MDAGTKGGEGAWVGVGAAVGPSVGPDGPGRGVPVVAADALGVGVGPDGAAEGGAEQAETTRITKSRRRTNPALGRRKECWITA